MEEKPEITTLISVSYTHLDVYKRQIQGNSGGTITDIDGRYTLEEVDADADVYKRQLYS